MPLVRGTLPHVAGLGSLLQPRLPTGRAAGSTRRRKDLVTATPEASAAGSRDGSNGSCGSMPPTSSEKKFGRRTTLTPPRRKTSARPLFSSPFVCCANTLTKASAARLSMQWPQGPGKTPSGTGNSHNVSGHGARGRIYRESACPRTCGNWKTGSGSMSGIPSAWPSKSKGRSQERRSTGELASQQGPRHPHCPS